MTGGIHNFDTGGEWSLEQAQARLVRLRKHIADTKAFLQEHPDGEAHAFNKRRLSACLEAENWLAAQIAKASQ